MEKEVRGMRVYNLRHLQTRGSTSSISGSNGQYLRGEMRRSQFGIAIVRQDNPFSKNSDAHPMSTCQ
jgi:hypothetical protein